MCGSWLLPGQDIRGEGRSVSQHPATVRDHRELKHRVGRGEAGRKVMVVGGGVAGLEAARVCAERGHKVVLFEAGSQLGGQVRLAQRATWRRDLGNVADWLVAQVGGILFF